jgi:hypothetical protein
MTSKPFHRKPSGTATLTGKENNSLVVQRSTASEPGVESLEINYQMLANSRRASAQEQGKPKKRAFL